jgi:hypothetical protein
VRWYASILAVQETISVNVCSRIFTEIIPTKINDIQNMNLYENKTSIHLLEKLVG